MPCPPLARLQGSLLSALLAAPLRLSSLTVALPLPAGAAADAAAAVEAAGVRSLRRALVERTTALAGQLPPPFCRAAEQPLALRVICPAAGSTLVGSGSGPLTSQRLAGLGLVAGGARRVPGGSTLAWHAPPSSAVLGKNGLRPAAAAAAVAQQQQQQQEAAGGGPAAAAAAAAADVSLAAAGSAPPVLLVRGGTQEGIAGALGVKQGHSRKGGAPPAPAAAPAISKSALLSLFWVLVRELAGLEEQQQQEQEQERQAGLPVAAAPGGGSAGAGPAPGAAACAAQLAAQLASGCTYGEAKCAAGAAYQAAWRAAVAVPGGVFEGWIPKPRQLEAFLAAPGE